MRRILLSGPILAALTVALLMLGGTPPRPASAGAASAVSAGGSHTCALTTTGGVKCWGANYSGELGDGTTINRTTPVDVVGLTSGVAAVAAGGNHTCAVTTAGGLKCWGNNGDGQLGDGTTTDRWTPVDVVGLTGGVAAVAAEQYHTCALTTAGALKCWGGNFAGMLGDGTTTSRLTPVDVSGLTSGVAAVATGWHHTCAVTTAGGLKCWGHNGYGQLGDGTAWNRLTPVDVVGLTSGVAAVAAGDYHTCAVTTAGGLKCWGYNGYGQLGDGTTTNRLTPVDVSGLTSGVAAIGAQGYHTCALTTAGALKCWGCNDYGQLGDGTTTRRLTPVNVVGLTSGVATHAAGRYHTCAIRRGALKCWGYNYSGQLGDGTTTNRTTPVTVVGLAGEGSPDLVETALSAPPTSKNRGTSFTVTDSVENIGVGPPLSSSFTRYYLSLDTLRDAGDKLLTGKRAVPALAPGDTSTGTKSVTIPANTALGTYFLLACADDTLLVPESDETNNCTASVSTIQVTAPDLKMTVLANPPVSVRQGDSFNVLDWTKNVGTGPAGASTTRYYLSLDKTKSAGDVRLAGSRAVAVLAPGSSSTGSVVVVTPPTTPLGTYYLLACADDLKVVKESKEGNNCRASASQVQVTAP